MQPKTKKLIYDVFGIPRPRKLSLEEEIKCAKEQSEVIVKQVNDLSKLIDKVAKQQKENGELLHQNGIALFKLYDKAIKNGLIKKECVDSALATRKRIKDRIDEYEKRKVE
jgi:hypothetical protein